MSLSEALKKYSAEDAKKSVFVYSYDTPVSKLFAAADDDYLYFLIFDDFTTYRQIDKTFTMLATELKCSFIEKQNKILKQLGNELKEYFDGKLKKFTVPLKTNGTDFQKEVWNKLQELPYGSTLTYSDLAKSMGKTTGHSRAVGAACGANSHLLIIPCHRVVASGSNGGFTGGINRKEWLLKHEKQYADN